MKKFLSFLLFLSILSAKEPINLSMVISGGVSLGAYEAGYNWAIIKLLKAVKQKSSLTEPKLLSLAGASAGSINALISAVYWCQQSEYKNSVSNNLFFNTWTDIDITDLIIQNKDSDNKTTLFTRRPLIKKAQNILKHMQKPIFQKGCQIPLGIVVTKTEPIIEEFQGIEIKNQSFAIPLKVYEKNSKLYIKNLSINKERAKFLNILKIPQIDRDFKKIQDILFASSAFPGAFTQVKLNYIYKGKRGLGYFLDGGVYNNIPLDLALALAPKADSFIFIDPNSKRKFNPKECKKAKSYLKCKSRCRAPKFKKIKSKQANSDISSGFLSTNLFPLFKSTQIFRSMRLYETINRYFRYNPNMHLILSSRYHPITGKFMWAFGAFLDKNFREYDYYVGVYDAIYRFAQEAKKRGFAHSSSLAALMNRYKDMLHLEDSKDAITVYKMLLKAEFCNQLPNAKANRFAAIYRAFNLTLPDSKRYTPKEFTKFLAHLDTTHIPLKEGSFLAYAKANPKGWYKQTAQSIVARIAYLENQRAKEDPDYAPLARVVDFSAWLSMSKLSSKKGLKIQPLFIPKNDLNNSAIYRLFPHEIAFDTINGGVSLGYSIFWYQKWLVFDGIEGKLSLNIGKHINNHLRVDIDPFINLQKGFSLGAGVSVFGNLQHGPFWKRDSAFGLNAYIDYNDIFRFSYIRRFNNPNRDYFYFGIKNLSSLFYWLNR